MSSGQSVVDREAEKATGGRQLDIRLSENVDSPGDEYQLLVAFHFGNSPAPHDHPAIVSPGLLPLDRDHVYECWWYRGDVTFNDYGPVKVAECDDYSVAIFQEHESSTEDYRAFTYRAYRELLQAIQATQHTQLVKVWNYLGGINSGDDDREKYRQFSIGRADAFVEYGIGDDNVPTGTAIGTLQADGLSLIALASKQNLQLAENPRQVSAFDYPRQYGPSSPKFSRGGFVATNTHKLYLISGTAAVVGHESAFPYDVAMQSSETLTNLAVICEAVSATDMDGADLVLDHESFLRVYLRNSNDLESVAGMICKALGHSDLNVVYLQGHICRRELMVEIDAAKAI